MEIDEYTEKALKKLEVHPVWKTIYQPYPVKSGLLFPSLNENRKCLQKITFTGNEDDLMDLLHLFVRLKEVKDFNDQYKHF